MTYDQVDRLIVRLKHVRGESSAQSYSMPMINHEEHDLIIGLLETERSRLLNDLDPVRTGRPI